MRRFGRRWTVRRFAIALAAVALVGTGAFLARGMLEKRAACLDFAEDHAAREAEERRKLDDIATVRSRGLDRDPLIPVIEELARARLAFHAAMRRKWRRAAYRPWEAITPEPEEPTDDRIVTRLPMPGPLSLLTADIPKLMIAGSSD